ncbi:hypothetical protein FZ103_19775 [Streptomonospora sp. PA3]|nr:hypothetical protein [Streptomonospora sp. PA3]
MAASLRASRELGPDYDAAIADAIAERLDRAVDERVRSRLAEAGLEAKRPGAPAAPEKPDRQGWTPRMTMGLLAMCFAVPMTAICGSFMGPAGIVLAWAGILICYVISIAGTRR